MKKPRLFERVFAGVAACAFLAGAAFSQTVPVQEPSSDEDIQAALSGGVPMGRWKEGLTFEGISPQPWLQSAANWFPRTEDVQPNEMRIIFMGTAPFIRPGQMNTAILVELGNGKIFMFDIGEGSPSNIIASGYALNQISDVFLSHLHVDHFGGLAYLWMFGTWAGGWHQGLTVHGPSGRTEEYGTKTMIEGMKMMTGWHRDAFSVFPVGKGWDINVNEFDFRDNGGVVYEEDGVRVIHWQRSHAKDGASGYRLDWNGLCFIWTGDGRPNMIDVPFAKGCDVFVTEQQQEILEISSGVQGVPPFLGRYTVDTHHTPSYAAGYIANLVQPRLFMNTHFSFDPYQIEETVAEIREHWKGPYHFGAPDGIVVNVTKDLIWVREGILPDFPNSRSPQFDFSNGQLVVPHPPQRREDIQEPYVRDMEIDPKLYYPEGYHPELLTQWPVDSDLVIPLEQLPEALKESMGAAWRLREKNQEVLREQSDN
ncbi:MAG: guanitoxin biosynthesis MBL fold metallo-hydrolase GntH [Ruegeria sp.]